ncbi:MAG: hypothetical protein AB7N70_35145 [Dehalococcoidia bacterium]
MYPLRHGDYRLTLIQGYLGPRAPPEREVAAKYYNLAKRLWLPSSVRQQVAAEGLIGDPTHVWVIGAAGWIANAPRLMREIAEDDSDQAYRQIILGQGLAPVGRPGNREPGWDDGWRYRVGMARRKKSTDRQRFEQASHALLGHMLDRRAESPNAPSEVLGQLGIPFEFCGDH